MRVAPSLYNVGGGWAMLVLGLVLAWRQGNLGLSGKWLRNLFLALGVFSF